MDIEKKSSSILMLTRKGETVGLRFVKREKLNAYGYYQNMNHG